MKVFQISQFLWATVVTLTFEIRKVHGTLCTATVPNVVQGNIARCTSYQQCKNAIIAGCDAVFCLDKEACKEATIGANYVECSATFTGDNAACREATIVASCLKCTGGSCSQADFNFGNNNAQTGYQGLGCAAAPSSKPSAKPSSRPSKSPSAKPSKSPSAKPSSRPSKAPSAKPSSRPSKAPSTMPSKSPSAKPSLRPSQTPSKSPSNAPSRSPSKVPVAQTVPGPSIIDKKKLCFSAWNTLEIRGKGFLAMDSVQVGDFVRANDSKSRDSFSRVISVMHMNRDAEVEYIQIYTERSDMPLEISPDHFLYSVDTSNNKRKVMRARDVQVGDTLGTNKVTQIQSIKRRGLYAPVTESGQIVVSGILASCYVGMFDDVPLSIQAAGSHSALAPLRVACLIDFSICENELHSNDGFSTNLLRMIDLGLQLSNVGVAMQLLFLVLCFPVLATLFMLENLINHGYFMATSVVIFVLLSRNKATVPKK